MAAQLGKAVEDYKKAVKMGRKFAQSRINRGLSPYLEVLDEIMPAKGAYSEYPLGQQNIPIDQIVGTKSDGRSNSFAGNFMPLFDTGTEFSQKWINLAHAHETEGIRDAVIAYEYLNKYYIMEGNKRVSVLKYFDAVSVLGNVTRILPAKNGNPRIDLYYEFNDFYQLAPLPDLVFSEPGSYAKFQKLTGKEPDQKWSEDDILDFNSVFATFCAQYKSCGGEQLTSVSVSDAFLAFISIYDYQTLKETTANEMKKMVSSSFAEFRILEEDEQVDLLLDPTQKQPSLIERILPVSIPHLTLGFLYPKTPDSSGWIYGHELGRLYLEENYENELTTFSYENITQDNIEENIQKAIADGCNIIFNTSPVGVEALVKAAIENPEVRFFNCSLHTSHKYIHTYYSRMHEAKFILGAIAGSMAADGKIGYLADHPIAGTIANINAFALGASMVNPRAKIYLEWSKQKNQNYIESFREKGIRVISAREFPRWDDRYYGLFELQEERAVRLAMPIYHWGRFYMELVKMITNGTWKADDKAADAKAVNYWWGMSTGVIDIIKGKKLPPATVRLVDFLASAIQKGEFNPFGGVIYSQNGVVSDNPDAILTPDQVATMDWLCENVVGQIPASEELEEDSKALLSAAGVGKAKPEV